MINLKRTIYFALATMLIIFLTSGTLQAYPNGIAGRTKKNTNSGCSCHGSNADPTVNVSFSGPETVTPGQTVTYTLLISKSGKSGAGIDVATRNGALAPVSNTVKLMSGEITHTNNIPMTSGSVSVQFSYTAPITPGIDTLWATGLATNSDNGTDGDVWNWSLSKRITISNTVGINIINEILPETFTLGQNYPNPFNPSTKIKFAIPVQSKVNLSIIDMSGKEVMVLVNNEMNAGSYEYELNASGLSSGIYFYRIKAANYTATHKMALIR